MTFLLTKLPIVLCALVAVYVIKFKPTYDLHGLEHLPQINNQHCRVLRTVKSSEDIAVDQDAGIAYLGSGREAVRLHYHPGMGRLNNSLTSGDFQGLNVNPYRDDMFLFDLETEKFTKLNVKNYDGEELVTHGTSLRSFAKGTNTLYLINHKRTGSVVSIFRHKLGTSDLVHIRDVKSRALTTLNSVAPLDEKRFLISNDHGFRGGIFRRFEDAFGFKHLCSIALCEITDFSKTGKEGVKCRKLISGLTYANGLEYLPKTKEIVVGETYTGVVSFYKFDGRKATYDRQTDTHTGLDNIKLTPGTDDLTIVNFPSSAQILEYVDKGLDYTGRIQIMASVLKAADGYRHKTVAFHDDTSKLGGFGFLTGALFVPKYGKLLGGSVTKEGLLVCDIDYATL